MRAGLSAATSIRPSATRRVVLTGSKSQDRKSTRLNSSHLVISYAVFCLKKKKKKQIAAHTVQRDVPRPTSPAHDDSRIRQFGCDNEVTRFRERAARCARSLAPRLVHPS